MSGWISSMRPRSPAQLYSAYKLLGAPLVTKKGNKTSRWRRGDGVLPSCSPIMFKLDCSLSLSTIYLHSTRKNLYFDKCYYPPFLTRRTQSIVFLFSHARVHKRAPRSRAVWQVWSTRVTNGSQPSPTLVEFIKLRQKKQLWMRRSNKCRIETNNSCLSDTRDVIN